MPSLGQYTAIVAQLVTDIEAAWDSIGVIYKGRPLIAPTEPSFAIIHLAEVSQEFDSVKNFEQVWRFEIHGQFQWPSTVSTNILDDKVAKANALVPSLEVSPYASGACYLNRCTKIVLEPDEDEQEQVYRIMVEFECRVSAQYGA